MSVLYTNAGYVSNDSRVCAGPAQTFITETRVMAITYRRCLTDSKFALRSRTG